MHKYTFDIDGDGKRGVEGGVKRRLIVCDSSERPNGKDFRRINRGRSRAASGR